MSDLNTIFEQDGIVYAVCSHNVPPKDLAKFISQELRYGAKHIPHFQMRVVSTDEIKNKMKFGKPAETIPPRKNVTANIKPETLL